MSTSTTDTAPAPVPQEPRPGHPDRRDDPGIGEALRSVYRLFHDKKFGLILILAMSILTLFGVLFPQAPAEVAADPATYQQWLDGLRPRYGGWTTPLSVLGIFTMFGSWAFRIVTTLLILSIIACTVHRIPLLWRQATQPHLHVTDGFFGHARMRHSYVVNSDPAEALGEVESALRRRRMRIVPDPKSDGRAFYADRNRFAPFGTVLAHTAFVIILLGMLLTGNAGFRDDSFTVPVGGSRDVGHGTDLSLQVVSFADTYHPDGRPKDYVSNVILYEGGTKVAQQDVRVNTPLRYDGVKFNQASFGIAASVTITGADGTVLYDGGVPLNSQTDDGQYAFGKFEIASPDLLVYVVAPASGKVDPDIAAGQVRVEIYPGDEDTPLAGEVVTQGTPAQVGDLRVTFNREQQYTGLMVSKDPGAVYVWTGAILLALGTFFTMFLRHHRLWVRATEEDAGGTRVQMACPDRYDITFENEFRRLSRLLGVTPTSGATDARTRK